MLPTVIFNSLVPATKSYLSTEKALIIFPRCETYRFKSKILKRIERFFILSISIGEDKHVLYRENRKTGRL
jgi:hypothetical protein